MAASVPIRRTAQLMAKSSRRIRGRIQKICTLISRGNGGDIFAQGTTKPQPMASSLPRPPRPFVAADSPNDAFQISPSYTAFAQTDGVNERSERPQKAAPTGKPERFR